MQLLNLDAVLRGLGAEPPPSSTPDIAALFNEFVHDPASYCDPSWLPLSLVMLRTGRPLQSELAKKAMSSWLIREAGGTGNQPFGLDEPVQRAALLPNALLETVIQIMGLLSFGQPLRHLLDRQRAARVQTLFGRDTYMHALRLCEFFPKQNDMSLLLEHREDLLREGLRHCGFMALRWTLGGQDQELAARLSLKFDKALSAPSAAAGQLRLLPTGAGKVREHLIPLVKALDPSWDFLF